MQKAAPWRAGGEGRRGCPCPCAPVGRRPEQHRYARSIGAAHAVSTRVEEVVQGRILFWLLSRGGLLDIVTAMLPALKPGAVRD